MQKQEEGRRPKAFLSTDMAEMQAVLDSVCNGVVVVNHHGIVTFFNTAAETISGLEAKNVIGQMVDDVIPNTGLIRVMETGLPEVNQRQFIGKCEVLTNRTPIIKDGMLVGAVGIFQDITEFNEVVTQLEDIKRLKSTLESIMESMHEGIVVVDKTGHITMLNKAYSEFLAVDPKAVVGKHVADVIENTRMHLVAQEGKAEVTDIQKIKDNTCIVTRIPIVKDGEIIGAVGNVVFKDIRELKSLAGKLHKLESELEYYKEELFKAYGGKFTFESIIGNSQQIEWLRDVAGKAAKGTSTVLILGESGTGKELFAHAVHNASRRRQGPFIKVNCAALPENLLEAELFGYEEGAFTGARKGGKPGKFELANGGTIFLDEIGEMPLAMQVKLLRVLQERELERLGATKTIKLDIRVIAATNRDLEAMIEQNQFRQDLYYRLNIFTLQIPPLRERTEDIPLLCQMLLKKIRNQIEHWVEGVTPEAMALLMQYNWPGNVRELENVLERVINLMDDETMIAPEHLPSMLKKLNRTTAKDEDGDGAHELADIKDDAEKQAIMRALTAAEGNKSKAARLLGIHRSGFYQKLQKYNLLK
ncbi:MULTISPECIES: sigma-54-dependent Fis family transcriptional regulator [Sporomusa]|jgi:PAS domain S-box-containing protein|uniref:Putative sigma L-dependent transcriptional regulator YqiR n=1 Tax=uncultured Sporomusa sp. TaxID=307249 RepID=A0A212LX00_9FIRM|nr:MULTISPECIES: sigma-54-dependent Fis family transcriptional regulator [Sporomusa]MCM0761352.1 sigma-54-dependent Fis family transcriptional regulator [Sporomusa sphaeroides DSM 2875]SCM82093.1 putative sigma L-dependent transcriptional regulator YqiR [uncultured Sporomusa sp.]HML32634.1 sigma-54-dependent Fis family transcriptional regulator [Sporomusa sphaeroides]